MAEKYVLTEYSVGPKQETGRDRRLGIRVALVSDLHEHDPAPILELLAEAKADIICVAGDTFEHHGAGYDPRKIAMMTTGRRIKHRFTGLIKIIIYNLFGKRSDCESTYSHEFIRKASKLADMYIGLGNHEWWLEDADYAVAAEAGAHILDNKDLVLECSSGERGEVIRIGGLSSVPDIEWLEEYRNKDGYRILISHHPEFYEEYELGDFDLVLSGHAHGGQWRIGGRGVFASNQGLLPRYHHGVYGRMVVSAGSSNTTAVPRFGNPCEVVVINI